MPSRSRVARVATAAVLAAALVGISACTTDDDSGPDNDDAVAAGSGAGAADAAAESDPAAIQTPLEELALAEGEAPANGYVVPVDPAEFSDQIAALEEYQERAGWDDPACDHVTRLESVSNHVAGDAVTRVAHYRDPDVDETVHSFPIALLDTELPEYMDRGLYEACDSSRNIDNPEYELSVEVHDAPEVEGAHGFRVTTDLITHGPGGPTSIHRTLALHGEARGITTLTEYQLGSEDPAVDPVRPEAYTMIDELYRAQMEKIVAAE